MTFVQMSLLLLGGTLAKAGAHANSLDACALDISKLSQQVKKQSQSTAGEVQNFPRNDSAYADHFKQLDEVEKTLATENSQNLAKTEQLLREIKNFPEGSPQHTQIKRELEILERKREPYQQNTRRRLLEKAAFTEFMKKNAGYLDEELRATDREALTQMNKTMSSLGYRNADAVTLKAGPEFTMEGAGWGGKLGAIAYRKKLSDQEIESVLKVYDRTSGKFIGEERIIYNKSTGLVSPQTANKTGLHGDSKNCFLCHSTNLFNEKTQPAERTIKTLIDSAGF